MLEAGIVGKRCYSVLDPEIAENQEGMLHFQHLTQGGFLRTARSFEEHFEQLGAGLEEQVNSDDELQDFIREFLRPHGVKKPATPVVVNAIEEASLLKAAPIPRWPLIFAPLLFPFAANLHAVAADRKGKKWDNVNLRVHFAKATKQLLKDVAHRFWRLPRDSRAAIARVGKKALQSASRLWSAAIRHLRSFLG